MTEKIYQLRESEYVFGLMPPFISPSEYETEYDMMTFREIH